MPKGKHNNHARGPANGRWRGGRKPSTQLGRLWFAIRNRCNNPNGQDWRHYGGRGIEICSRWSDFERFSADVGQPPGPGWTLDRIDNDGNYEPGNVRWATRRTQGRNRGYCKLNLQLAADIKRAYGRGARQIDLAAHYGVSQALVSQVVRGLVWV